MMTEDINKELEQLSPNVSRIRNMNINNQTVPTDYFEEVESYIYNQVILERALFKQVPDQDYFKKVEATLYSDVRPTKKAQASKNVWLRYAASFAGLIVLSVGLWKTNDYFSSSSIDNQYSNVSLDAFVDELSDMEVDNLYSLLNYNNSLQEPLDFDKLIEDDLESTSK